MSTNLHENDQLKVMSFINDFVSQKDYETIRTTFRAGYCWYFAHMLQQAFDRGTVCLTHPIGHFVWVDDDNTAYDIEGIYYVNKHEINALIPEKYLGVCLNDFKHTGNEHNSSIEEIELIYTNFINAVQKGDDHYYGIEV